MNKLRQKQSTQSRTRRQKPKEQKKYGHYRCSKCRNQWKSANTWVYHGKLVPIYSQDCIKCKTPNKAFQVDHILCGACGHPGEWSCPDNCTETLHCQCERTKKVATKQAHQQNLCHKCRFLDTPCGSKST